jgi:pyrroline-5-carboxylate reductase
MGSAIVDGLRAADAGRDITITVRDAADIAATQHRFPTVRVTQHIDPSDGVVLSVKPWDTVAIARSAAEAGAQRVLSVAAGVTLESLQFACGPHVSVVRAMPNVGAQLQRSATGYCVSDGTSPDDIAWAESVLRPLGAVVRVEEPQIDAVTGIAGSGIAFVLLVLEALIDAGVAEGLDADQAHELAVATLSGAAAVAAGDESPAEIRARVTTPNGTTAAGLRALEERDLRGVIRAAVSAAAERSREMGQ